MNDTSAEEQHYRRAESAFCRGGGVSNAIRSVDYHYLPGLEDRFEAKRREYDARFGEDGHSIIYGFHGTASPFSIEGILRDGFKLSFLGKSTGNAGYYGAGIYFSEGMWRAQQFVEGHGQLMLCKILLGKPCVVSQAVGRGLELGCTSHVSDASGSEVVIFDESCVLPVYVIHTTPSPGCGILGSPLKGLHYPHIHGPLSRMGKRKL